MDVPSETAAEEPELEPAASTPKRTPVVWNDLVIRALSAGAIAGVLIGVWDGYLAATRSGLVPLAVGEYRSTVSLAMGLIGLVSVCLGLLAVPGWGAARHWNLWFRFKQLLKTNAFRLLLLFAAGGLLAAVVAFDRIKRPQWDAVDWGLPIEWVVGVGTFTLACWLGRAPRTWVSWLAAGTLSGVILGALSLGLHSSVAVERLATESSWPKPILATLRSWTDEDNDRSPTRFCGDVCDCDDSRPDVYPGAFDIPDNGVDEDCDGKDAKLADFDAIAKSLRSKKPQKKPVVEDPADAAPAKPVREESETGPSTAQPTNVVFIIVDTLRADHVSAYGYRRPTTPNIDELAHGGVLFEQARAAGSQTRFSVPPMLVGKYFTEIARTPGKWPAIYPSETLISERFKAGGYQTAAFHSVSYFRKEFGMDQGFDHYNTDCFRMKRSWRVMATSDCVTDRVIAHVDSDNFDEGRPFFFLTYYGDPHAPYLRHKSVPRYGSTTTDVYDEEITFTDRHIGRMLDALKTRGLLANTAVVFTSDHGEGLDEKLDHGHRYHGANLYDETVRVPLIIKAPGAKGRRVKTPVSLIDMVPTLLDLAELPVPEDARGMSLVPYVKGANPKHPPVFFEKEKESALPQKGMVMWPYKVIWVVPYNRIKIFNLENDPRELTDIKKKITPELYRKLVTTLKIWSSHVLKPKKARRR